MAAKALFITQPAVSKSISRLEEALGCKLFDRTNKMSLTSEGAVLYARISKAFQHIAAGVSEISDITKLNNGEICIGAVHMIIRYFLLPYVESFHKKHPSIAIKFNYCDMQNTPRMLKAGKIDFGIVTLPVDDPEGFELIHVGKMRDVFLAGERFSELKDKEVSLKEIATYPIICLKSGMLTRRYLDSLFLEKNIILKPIFEMEMMDIMVPLAEIGLGISHVMDKVAERSINEGKTFEVKLKELMPERAVCVIKNKGMKLAAAGSAFVDEMLSAL